MLVKIKLSYRQTHAHALYIHILAIWLGRLQFSNFWWFCHCHYLTIESISNAPKPMWIWAHIALSAFHVWKQSIGENKDLNNSAARNNNWFFLLVGWLPRLWHSRHYAVRVSCDCIRWYSEHVYIHICACVWVCVCAMLCISVNAFYFNWLDGVHRIRN